jgi:hypothetical protein
MAYVSETTKFLDELLEKNPQLIEQQKRNRLTWWDRPQDLETMRDNAESNVSQPAYVYFPLPTPKT